MAILKRGSRSIVVDGTTYRWYVRRKASYGQEYSAWNGYGAETSFAVEHGQSRGGVLIVTLPQAHPSIQPYIDWPVVPVVPSQVAHYIALALAKGWQPAKPGAAFHMKIAA